MITFEYDGKIYKPSNLEKKLKKLGITINDIKIIDDTDTKAETERKEKELNKLEKSKWIEVYWDIKCKGWFIQNSNGYAEPDSSVDNERFKFVGVTKEDTLSEMLKIWFPMCIKFK